MLQAQKKLIMPNVNRDEDLRHLVESYEMKIRKSEYLTNQVALLGEEIC